MNPSVAFFPVELRPLSMLSGAPGSANVVLDRHFAVVDVERTRPFAVVTDDYELITNEKAFDQAEAIMRRVFNTTSIRDFACLNVTMPKTRSFCHIDLIHRSADFNPWEEDSWTAFLRISNSYNRTRLLRFELGFCRWICLNGFIFGKQSVEFSYAHTRRGKDRVDGFVENIEQIRKLEAQLTEKLHHLKRFYVPQSEMLAILCRAFDITVGDDVKNKPRRVEDLLALRAQVGTLTQMYFTEMGTHGYVALNVLTDYATRPQGVMAPEAAMHGLQQKAGNWMDGFITAIKDPGFSFDAYLGGHRKTAELIEAL